MIETVPAQTYYVGSWIKDLRPGNRRSATVARFKFEYLDSEIQGILDDSQTYSVDLPIPQDDKWHWVNVELIPSITHPWVRVLLVVENWSDDGSESD